MEQQQKNLIKKFIEYTHLYIIFFLHKNIKRRIILIFSYCALFLLIICIYFLFFKFIYPTIICDNNVILGETPAELRIFSEKHLLDFYVPDKYPDENLEKLCFSEGIAVLACNLIEIQHPHDRIFSLRRVLGQEYYECFKNFSYYVLQNSTNVRSINTFLNTVIYDEKSVNKEFLDYAFKDFLFDYDALYKKEWYPQKSFRQEVIYYKHFLTLEEVRPLVIPRLFNYYSYAISSSKFFKYLYYNDIPCLYYTDYGNQALKNFLNLERQNLSKTYAEAYGYYFDRRHGVIFKIKNILRHLYKLTRLYEKQVSEYYFLSGNLCFDETDILNFVYLDIYITINKETYFQILKEIEFAKILNTIFYYPRVASGRYYVKEAAKELRVYLKTCLANNVFKDTDNYVYVETLDGDHRVRRLIRRYLNLIIKSCFIEDQKTLALYKEHSAIFYSLLTDNKDSLTKKITYKQALKSIDFIEKFINKIQKEEDFLAKKYFPNINEIRKKQIYSEHFIRGIDEKRDKVFTIYYGPQGRNL